VGILVFVKVLSVEFLFLLTGIAISIAVPEGMQKVITLITMPIIFASNALYSLDASPACLKEFLSTIR